VALAAARAAAIAAAGAASAQGAAALATGAEDDKHAHATAEPAAPGSAGGDAVAGLFQLTPTTTASTAGAGATPTFQLHPSLDSGELAQGLSDRVTYMVDNGLNGAKLQVNPPQLGPIELRIAVTGGHAQVWMTAHSAVTRDALESSSPKLREMLGAQGFGQVSVDISQRSFQDRSGQAQPYQRMAAERLTAAAVAPAVNRAAPRSSPGGLDAYA
jgi:flagellar hook-length control protein FliK